MFGCPPITPELLLALVALINAVGGVGALIIHSLRVPYRESNAVESLHARDQLVRWRESGAHIGERPPPPPPSRPPSSEPPFTVT